MNPFTRLGDIAAYLNTYRRFKARDGWSREQMQGFQNEQLQSIVRYAAAHSPFYRELYGSSAGPVRLGDLPVIDKRTVMENFDRLVTDSRLKLADIQTHLQRIKKDETILGEYRAMTTGGSSGLTGVFVYNRREWSHVIACMLRGGSYLGVGVRLPRRVKAAFIGAHSPVHMTYRAAKSFDMGLHNTLRLQATLPIAELATRLDTFQPEFIQGYPSVIALLAVEQLEGRLNIHPRVISTGSEVQTEEMAAQIRRAWGIQPFNGYGTTEGLFGAECSLHQGIHLFEDLCIVEVVDEHNRPVPDGVGGHKLLITNFFNFTQPLIRYEITDMVTLGTEPCPCGRPHRLVKRIEGRSDDIIYLKSAGGREVPVHPIHLRSPMVTTPEVKQYQMIHDSEGLHVHIALREGAAPEEVSANLRAKLSGKLEALGAAVPPIEVQVVDRIEPGKMGKAKLVVSLMPRRT